MDKKDLVSRLNRVGGQIEAIKRSLDSEQPADCKATLQLLKASINALKKFGESYVTLNMNECLDDISKDELKEQLKEIISLGFSL